MCAYLKSADPGKHQVENGDIEIPLLPRGGKRRFTRGGFGNLKAGPPQIHL
ncbi:hypothetical protein D3C80_2232170 [compost metagenome]